MDDKKIPYPELDGIREDEKTLKIVSPAYAGDESELTAVLQYTYQAILLGETGHKDLAETLKKISMDENGGTARIPHLGGRRAGRRAYHRRGTGRSAVCPRVRPCRGGLSAH